MKVYACFLGESSSRHQHETAHKLLDFALKKEYGIERYTLGKGSHGKPFLSSCRDIKINLSHCTGLAVCSAGDVTIGVDCEKLRTVRDGVVRRVFTESERLETKSSNNPDLTFTRFWTLKESFVKAVGRGVSYPMKNAVFSFDGSYIYSNIKGACFRQWVILDKYVISLCCAAAECEASLNIITEKALNC